MGKLQRVSSVKLNVKTYLRSRMIIPSIALFLCIVLSLSAYLQLELPSPTGPHPVGRAILRWVDPSRPEVMTEEPDDSREVMALIWYPAQANTGVNAGYFPGLSTVSEPLIQSGEVAWWEATGLRYIRAESRLDAEPLREQVPFPVLLFLPGNATNIEFYSSLAAEIASHGYVVVGLNHPYDVPAVELSDGRVAPYDREQWSLDPTAHQAYIRERHPVKIGDVLFALEQLERLHSNPESPLAGVMDLDAIAAAGHSLGGIAASEACTADSRFKACINLDGLQQGGPFSMEETAIPPTQPFLFLTKESQLHPKLVESFESTAQSYWVVVHGAEHDSFTDGPQLRSLLLPGADQAQEHMILIQTYTLEFLDTSLKGHRNDLFSQPFEREDVSVRVFPSR